MNIKNQNWMREDGSVLTLGDPRLHVARHIAWTIPRIANFPDCTWYNGLEPDNYTDAIMYKKPCFIPNIKNQIWFKDKIQSCWISLYYVSASERSVYESWLGQNEYWAIWAGKNVPAPRYRLSDISLQTNNSNKRYVRARLYEERLFDLGYMDKLIHRGISKEYISSKIGIARTFEIEPEEQLEQLEQ